MLEKDLVGWDLGGEEWKSESYKSCFGIDLLRLLSFNKMLTPVALFMMQKLIPINS